jgi:hypothetical protein
MTHNAKRNLPGEGSRPAARRSLPSGGPTKKPTRSAGAEWASTWAENPIEFPGRQTDDSTMSSQSRETETEAVIREFRRMGRPVWAESDRMRRSERRRRKASVNGRHADKLPEEALSVWGSEGGSF